MSLILRVAVGAPLRRCFDYLPPQAGGGGALVPGVRVKVPFGRGTRVGVLIETVATPAVARDKLKRAQAVIDEVPVLPAPTLALLTWASRYYHHPIGEVVAACLPAPLRSGREAGAARVVSYRPRVASTAAGTPRHAPRQEALLAFMRQHPGGLDAAALDRMFARWRGPMRELLRKGWAETFEPAANRVVANKLATVELNPAQGAAVRAVTEASGRFQPFVLNGVTGSGKTEVYFGIIDAVIRDGRQALVLVPEIGLTGATVARFAARFDAAIAVLHSGLTDRERLEAWLAARDGRAAIVIGTRSAVWTPLSRPGVVIVDEEHDLSYKQQEGFRYSARDLAVTRARLEGVPIVLGSATPALETLHNLREGRYREVRLPQRAGAARPPVIDVIDLRQRPLTGALSEPLLGAIEERLGRAEQVLIFLNRRGYAPVLLCHDCGATCHCRRCDAHLVYHRDRERLICHHCGAERPLSPTCEECGGERMRPVGHGTERVVETLRARFPQAHILRIDRDTTRGKGALDTALESARRGTAQILVGTQMLSKGHHFPGVTLAAVVDADSRLHSVDFRAPERLAQLVEQVAGRAGRGDRPGRVLIQTHYPDHPLLRTLIRQGYEAVGTSLLEERRATALPPYSYLALLRAEAPAARPPQAFLEAARDLADRQAVDGVRRYGPMPAPMLRRAGRHRAQLLLQAAGRGALHRLLDAWVPLLEEHPLARRVRWSLDVDPQEVL